MNVVTLRNGSLSCEISMQGGAIWRLDALATRGAVALLRPPPPGGACPVGKSGCFPLVPFGNRVAGNRFRVAGREYRLRPNTAWDPHYLHGDGWLRRWSVADSGSDCVRLILHHHGQPYRYAAEQSFKMDGPRLNCRLAVTNTGGTPMPFGLGWHPFFPLEASTTLLAPAAEFWTEKEGWLPDARRDMPVDLDFSSPRRPPRRWINNGFEGWTGKARIDRPEAGVTLSVATTPRLSRYFLFVSDPAFDRSYDYDFFCFEPMSHAADGHNQEEGGGLRILAPGQGMEAQMHLQWSALG